MTVSDHRNLVTALLGVDGVAEAAVERGGDDDLGSLRLLLQPGADEVAVAGAVNDLLRARFGLAVDTDRVRVLEEPAPNSHPPQRSDPPFAPDEAAAPQDEAAAPSGGEAVTSDEAAFPASPLTAVRTPRCRRCTWPDLGG